MKLIMHKAPMGWNSYDYYDTTVTEEQVKANADYMAAHLREYGWEYVVVDIQWYARDAGSRREQFQYIPFGDMEMDGYGRYQPAENRFPSARGGQGFGPLAAYIHGLGLRFGIHIMRGIPRLAAHRHLPVEGTAYTAADVADPASICGWNPDMYGVRDNEAGQAYYDSLIRMYADWGVDYIKCDDICDSWMYRNDSFSGWHETRMLQEAIGKSGRDIVLSLSPGPAHIDRAWQYEKYANMWRITDDFWDRWELLLPMFGRCELWQNHVAAGSYPDCDMLPLGRIGKGFGHGEWDCNFTKEEQKTMMTLWCIFGSPLMVGAELTKLDEWSEWLLTRKEILKLTENAYVGRQVERDGQHAVWSCLNRETGERYLALFNLKEEEQTLSCDLREVEQFVQAERDAGKVQGTEEEQCAGKVQGTGEEQCASKVQGTGEEQCASKVQGTGEEQCAGKAQGTGGEQCAGKARLASEVCPAGNGAGTSQGKARELWSGERVTLDKGWIRVSVPAHGTKLFKL